MKIVTMMRKKRKKNRYNKGVHRSLNHGNLSLSQSKKNRYFKSRGGNTTERADVAKADVRKRSETNALRLDRPWFKSPLI